MISGALRWDDLATAASAVSVADWFLSKVAVRGEAVALQFGGRKCSYRALNDRVNRVAAWINGQGLVRGDRISVLSENRSEYVEVELAAAKLGITTACLNWRQSDSELTHCIRLVEPKLVFVSERYMPVLERIDHGVGRVLVFGQDYEKIIAQATDAEEPPRIAELEDGLIIYYTSGTTGMPKAAVISHRAIMARTLISALDRPFAIEDSYLA